MSSPEPIGSAHIERQSEVPYYQQLARTLEERLQSGQIAPNARLPSENALCQEFGLSRATVRQALQQLEAQGMVRRVTNRGVFASSQEVQLGWTIQDSEFLENALTHQNRSVSTQVIRSGPETLPSFAQQGLGLPVDAEGFSLTRLRFLDGVPTVFSTNYFPQRVGAVVAQATDTLAGTGSLTSLLRAAGYRLQGVHRFVSAVLPPTEVAEALQIAPGTPLVRIRSTSWTSDGYCFDVYETYVNTDVVQLELAIAAVPRAPRQ
ncbi:GntR family transcriptional regulator [Micropruina sp.]|uniref:GntR family transcriptional regulator n=1 Tax=Micropruina sp. TaxID=2737536 RepID=UPI0039E4C0DD